MTAQPEPTREQLELAFRQLARPHRWPATLDAALAQPHFATCLRRIALNLGRPRWQGRPAAPGLPNGAAQYVPPTPSAPPPRVGSSGPAGGRTVDRKRAAANDLDD